jgi:general stress protein 26
MSQSAFFIHWNCDIASTAAMEAGPASVERLLAAAAATMEKARYCWAITVAEDGSANARPMGPQKSPASEDPFGILFLTRRGSGKALEIGRTGRLSVVYQHDADDSYVTLIGRGVIIADRALLRARWQPAWNRFFPAGVDDETSMFVQLEAERIELWVRGVTPEPFGTRGAIMERGPGQPWRLVQG